MASACVNNAAPPPDSAILDFASSCPRISFSRDLADGSGATQGPAGDAPEPAAHDVAENPDHEDPGNDLPDFEFRLDDPVTMLPADELFSDGKLVPLDSHATRPSVDLDGGKRSPEVEKPDLEAEAPGSEPCEKSHKAPKCSSRWRELLGLKRQQNPKAEVHKAAAPSSTGSNVTTRSFRHLLRHPKTAASADSSLTVPLLRDSPSEPASISARRSLSSSSSSSGTDHDELPRFSLDSERPSQAAPISLVRAPPRVRLSRPRVSNPEFHPRAESAGRSPVRRGAEPTTPRGASVDSPRMNASGKVVFQGLERSSSSPGSCHGGSHHRGKSYRGMERSYSANVRIAPVLNVVPVVALRVGSSKPGSAFGFGHLFTPTKKGPHTTIGGRSRIKIPDKDKV